MELLDRPTASIASLARQSRGPHSGRFEVSAWRAGLGLITIIVVLGNSAACGRIPSTASSSPGETVSAPRTATPSLVASPSSIPPPDSAGMTADNCSGPPQSTTARSLHYYTIRIATTWTDTGDYVHTETLLLELTAPSNYAYEPTRVEFHSDLGRVSSLYSSHSIATQNAATITQYLDSPEAQAGSVSDCTIGGDPAAVFGYSNGSEVGYRLYVLHKSYLFEIRFHGTGGIGAQALQDVKGMISSITWGSWTYPGEA